jgi:CheY-like chemotaxis protein
MPAMSGPDALSEMRRVRPDLPAVFMSGYTADDLGGLPADLGVRFLAKPFRPSELTKCVQAAVRR